MPRATVFMGVPTMYVRLLADPGLTKQQVAHDAALHLGLCTAADRDLPGVATPARATPSWSATACRETAMITSNPYRRARTASERGVAPWAFRCPATSCAWWTMHRGPFPVGEIGAIQVRGPNVFQGYWQHAREDRRGIHGRRLSSRPATWAVDDERGYVSIVGRSKDLIISAAASTSTPPRSRATSTRCREWPRAPWWVCRTRTSARSGVAVVIAKAGAAVQPEAILVARSRRSLANFKIPKRCFVVAELPRNAMGKVQKNLLRDQYKGLFAS
jgi:malonyl-CoA/methylmalonyl-CoA synthetase